MEFSTTYFPHPLGVLNSVTFQKGFCRHHQHHPYPLGYLCRVERTSYIKVSISLVCLRHSGHPMKSRRLWKVACLINGRESRGIGVNSRLVPQIGNVEASTKMDGSPVSRDFSRQMPRYNSLIAPIIDAKVDEVYSVCRVEGDNQMRLFLCALTVVATFFFVVLLISWLFRYFRPERVGLASAWRSPVCTQAYLRRGRCSGTKPTKPRTRLRARPPEHITCGTIFSISRWQWLW